MTREEVIIDLNRVSSITQIDAAIGRLAISADAKALLKDMTRITMQVGNAVVQLGKKIVSFVIDLVKKFPNTTFGMIAALTLSILIAGSVGAIPLVGATLAVFLNKLIVLFGLTAGIVADFKEAGLRAEVSALERKVAIVAQVG